MDWTFPNRECTQEMSIPITNLEVKGKSRTLRAKRTNDSGSPKAQQQGMNPPFLWKIPKLLIFIMLIPSWNILGTGGKKETASERFRPREDPERFSGFCRLSPTCLLFCSLWSKILGGPKNFRRKIYSGLFPSCHLAWRINVWTACLVVPSVRQTNIARFFGTIVTCDKIRVLSRLLTALAADTSKFSQQDLLRANILG